MEIRNEQGEHFANVIVTSERDEYGNLESGLMYIEFVGQWTLRSYMPAEPGLTPEGEEDSSYRHGALVSFTWP